MDSEKDIFNFCISAVFYDYRKGNFWELNQVPKCITNSFYKTIPYSGILVSLSIIDDIIFKTNNNYVEINIENIHDLRENIIYLLSFEKLFRDEQQNDRPISMKLNLINEYY